MAKKPLTLTLDGGGDLAGLEICSGAASWLRAEYGAVIPVRRFWLECNVPAWMCWALLIMTNQAGIATEANATIEEVVRLLYDSPPSGWFDNRARPDLADALRVIFPADYVEYVVTEWLARDVEAPW